VHALFKDRMAYVRERPWHGLGTKVACGTSTADFLRAAGLDWKVAVVPARGAKPGPKTKLHPGGRWSRYEIQREAVADEKEPVALGIVSHRYVPLQNQEAFAFFDPLLKDGWASLETAGVLYDGGTVWVQVRLREVMTIGRDDELVRFLLLRNRHDGEGSVSIRFTPIRVVCQNTLTFAERRQQAFANERHTGKLQHRLEKVRVDAIHTQIEAFSARMKTAFEKMVAARLEVPRRLELLDKLCGEVTDKTPPAGPTRRQMVDQRLAVQASCDPLAGNETVWALYNAITWVEDERVRKLKDEEEAVNRMWFGAGADNKAKAFEVLAVEAGAAE